MRVHHEGPSRAPPVPPTRLRVPLSVGFCVFLAIAVFLLWQEHRAHLFGALLFAVYLRLARREENEARNHFGNAYEQYAARTPAFIPRLRPRFRGSGVYGGGD